MKSFKVLRHHVGDRDYAPGDTRVADPAVVAHLVGLVLEEIDAAPSEPKPRAKK
jgi:hypothetical protein